MPALLQELDCGMTRAGIVTVAGKPNAGKSTLLNRIIRQKLAITSPKPQSTRNRVLNHLRHEKVERLGQAAAAADPRVEPRPHAALAEQEIDAAVRDAVATLPDRCREAFELSRVQGLRYAEIAAVMGISVKTVEAQMGKALRILRERLAPWLPEE